MALHEKDIYEVERHFLQKRSRFFNFG